MPTPHINASEDNVPTVTTNSTKMPEDIEGWITETEDLIRRARLEREKLQEKINGSEEILHNLDLRIEYWGKLIKEYTDHITELKLKLEGK